MYNCQHYSIHMHYRYDGRDDNASDRLVLLTLPYKGPEGASRIRCMKRSSQQTMTDINIVTIYKSKKLSTKFNVKYNTYKAHQHTVIYKASCPEPTCNASYIGETARRLDQRVKEYGGKDNNSYIFRHSVDAGLAMVESNNFKIIATGSKHTYTRKIAEALNIKRDKPSLNVSLLSFFKL